MEEIKASDIMLGNWFRGYDGEPFQWEIEHFAHLATVYPDEIIMAPIPLTEDILLRAGASVEKINLSSPYSPKGYVGRVFKMGEFTYYADKDEWSYRTTIINIPKCLHQLQNLFKALTGNDLKIEV